LGDEDAERRRRVEDGRRYGERDDDRDYRGGYRGGYGSGGSYADRGPRGGGSSGGFGPYGSRGGYGGSQPYGGYSGRGMPDDGEEAWRSRGGQESYRGQRNYRETGGYGGRSSEDRGFLDRAGDEVASWFGDEDAQRRRQMDARHRGRGPKNYTRSDDRIREDVSDRLSDDPHIDASEIEVSVDNGEVTLSGTVNERFAKRHAEDLAERVSGVKHVQNNLRVSAQQTSGGTSAGTTGGMSGATDGGNSAQTGGFAGSTTGAGRH
jgi:osmotically-inducible protein OsmY